MFNSLLRDMHAIVADILNRLFLRRSSEIASSPPRLITFFIPLKMPLPLPLTTLRFERDEEVEWLNGVHSWPTREAMDAGVDPLVNEGRNVVSLRLWNSTRPIPIATDLLDAMVEVATRVTGAVQDDSRPDDLEAMPWEDGQVSLTIVEAVTPLLATTDDDDEAVSDSFDRCLEHIEELAQAYRLASWDLYSVPVGRSSVYPFALLTVRDLSEGKYGPLNLFMVNFGEQHLAAPPKLIPQDEFDATMLVLKRARRKDPFMLSVRNRWSSDRALRVEGDASGAVVSAAISSEVLLNTILLSMAWEEGLSASEAAGWFKENLPKRLRTHYADRLGGSWDTYNVTTPLGKWYAELHRSRNRVVHTGHLPPMDEATAAVEARDAVEEFIVARLVDARNRYPRTVLMVSGIPGLQRRGVYSGQIRRFVDQQAAMEPDWTVALTSFMGEVENEVGRIYAR